MIPGSITDSFGFPDYLKLSIFNLLLYNETIRMTWIDVIGVIINTGHRMRRVDSTRQTGQPGYLVIRIKRIRERPCGIHRYIDD